MVSTKMEMSTIQIMVKIFKTKFDKNFLLSCTIFAFRSGKAATGIGNDMLKAVLNLIEHTANSKIGSISIQNKFTCPAWVCQDRLLT